MKRFFLYFFISLIFLLGTSFVSPLSSEETEAPGSRNAAGSAETSPLRKIPTYVQKTIHKKIWKQKELDVPLVSASIGDVDGDGLNELVTTDGRRIRIFQWKYGRFRPLQDSTPKGKRRFFSFWPWSRESFGNPLDEINAHNLGMRYLNLTAEDLDRDGKDEILFTCVRDGRLFSGILGYEKESFTQYLTAADLYLKIFREDDGRPILAGQALGSAANAVHRYGWDGSACRKQGPLKLPKGADLLTASSYRYGGTGAPAYVSFSNPEGLRLYTSPPSKTATKEELQGPTRGSVRIRVGDHGEKMRLGIRPRLLTGDFDGDGGDEALLILKRPRIRLWGFRGLSMRNMVADFVFANGLVLELWDTEPLSGEILDQAVGDVDNDGRDDLVLFAEKGLIPFSKGTRILIYELR